MTNWFVGMRVRLARPIRIENKGLTGRITHIQNYRYGDKLPSGNWLDATIADCYVLWDDPTMTGKRYAATRFYRLEPILPEGAQPSKMSFSEMMDNLRKMTA